METLKSDENAKSGTKNPSISRRTRGDSARTPGDYRGNENYCSVFLSEETEEREGGEFAYTKIRERDCILIILCRDDIIHRGPDARRVSPGIALGQQAHTPQRDADVARSYWPLRYPV
ncbi:hypothetical protein BHE74_00023626 [Ensete ventricosum]|nr:hypothetical protein GW17_00012024 [Ensete ventricosum]RWW68818.1 hypothetical protein BHE74_00023626 [Ensete ventricosum]RZR89035.1 hypothetical protein BHM03_00016703 [Ensete ventricosum]